jgi:glycosyltransferase involved in cell wall biosynthesis
VAALTAARRAPRILFVHDSYPAQFGAFGQWLAGQGWDVAFATAAREPRTDLRVISYAPHRTPSSATHPYAQPMDRAALRAQAFVRAALVARRGGYCPDLVMAHSGWGAGMFAKDIFPEAAFVPYCEWWYRYPGPDVAYLAALAGREAPPPSIEAPIHERARNAPIAMDLASADAAVCPTAFQAAQFPPVFRPVLTVQHDGVDTDFFSPATPADDRTLGGLVPEDARVVTYATRGMEPHRGFPQFMAALPAILAEPGTVAIVAGENRVAYGGDAARRVDWKKCALEQNGIDPARCLFVGHLDGVAYRALLRRSDVHVYLTVPFVLSWSALEAMSCGCNLVLSDTAPIREFADDKSAILVDLLSGELAPAIRTALRDGESAARRARARSTVDSRVSAHRQFPKKKLWLRSLLG